MKIPLVANDMPFNIVLSFQINKRCAINVRISDDDIPNTDYLNSRYDLRDGIKTISAGLPITGKRMSMTITCEADASKQCSCFQLLGIKTEKLVEKQIYLSQPDKEYFDYARWFVKNMGSLSPGLYKNDSGSATFRLFDVIIDDVEGEIQTPARVDHVTGEVQMSKRHMSQYSVPMNMFILTHERVHYSFNTKNEQECDRNAVNIVRAMGFPRLETIYAATKIFPDDRAGRSRTTQIGYLLDNYYQ